MKHYYTNNTDLESNPSTIEYRINNLTLNFTTDNGVFSKQRVDYGTRVLLKNYINQDNHLKVLDVGCGYGVIGVTLKSLYPKMDLDMIDVNERALSLTKLNAQNNNVSVNSFLSNSFEAVTNNYDLILTNPPIRAGKKVVMDIITNSFSHLNVDGELWVVIQKKQGAPSIKKLMIELFSNCTIVAKDKGYYILMSRKQG